MSICRYSVLFLANLALLGVFGSIPGAHAFSSVRTFGGRHGWDVMEVFSNVTLAAGWEGGHDIILSDAGRTVEAATDLLVSFEGSLRDQAGNYQVRNSGVETVTRPVRFGNGAAGFDGNATVAYFPGPGSLFTSDSQSGSFAIDFWMYPNHITEGATILRWRGALINGENPVLQDLRLEIHDRRLHWVLTNLVVRAGQGGIVPDPSVRLSGRRSTIPRTWQHHQLRFDSFTGQLAYLVDGVPEDIRYLSETGREDGTALSILFGHDTGDGIVLGRGFQGALDELRISRAITSGPQPARYTGESGVVLSRPIDLGGSGARLTGIESFVSVPGGTEVRGYYRLGNVVTRNEPEEALDAEWRAIPADGEIAGNERGRYLQLRYHLLADAGRDESPRVRSVRVRFDPAAPPPPPHIVTGRPVPEGVELSWDPVLAGDVAGYRVYFGERPRRYTGAAGMISPRDVGSETTVVITGLQQDVPYVFAVESYDRHGQSGTLSRETEVRAGREGESQ